MSELPKGTLAARNFAESVAVKGAMAALIAWDPFFGWFFVEQVTEAALKRLLLDPAFDDATAYAIAAKFVIDRRGFDSHYLKLKLLEHATPAEQEAAIEEAEKAAATFFRRGPVQ